MTRIREEEDYHKQIRWSHFGRNWNRNKGARYERNFESISVGFAVIPN